jgi:hypothetical protein
MEQSYRVAVAIILVHGRSVCLSHAETIICRCCSLSSTVMVTVAVCRILPAIVEDQCLLQLANL